MNINEYILLNFMLHGFIINNEIAKILSSKIFDDYIYLLSQS